MAFPSSSSQTWFTHLPPILVLELSRFQFNQTSGQAEKIHNPLDFQQQLFMDRYAPYSHSFVPLTLSLTFSAPLPLPLPLRLSPSQPLSFALSPEQVSGSEQDRDPSQKVRGHQTPSEAEGAGRSPVQVGPFTWGECRPLWDSPLHTV